MDNGNDWEELEKWNTQRIINEKENNIMDSISAFSYFDNLLCNILFNI